MLTCIRKSGIELEKQIVISKERRVMAKHGTPGKKQRPPDRRQPPREQGIISPNLASGGGEDAAAQAASSPHHRETDQGRGSSTMPSPQRLHDGREDDSRRLSSRDGHLQRPHVSREVRERTTEEARRGSNETGESPRPTVVPDSVTSPAVSGGESLGDPQRGRGRERGLDNKRMVSVHTGRRAVDERAVSILKVVDSAICPKCLRAEETPLHHCAKCPAYGMQRLNSFGRVELTEEELGKMPVRRLLAFLKSAGRLEEQVRTGIG